MKPLEKYDLGQFEIDINGHKTQATLVAHVYFDDSYGYYQDDDAETVKRVKSGELTPCLVAVKASALGFDGRDTLGSVLVAKPEDVTDAIQDNSMIDQAKDDLVVNILDTIQKLKPFFTSKVD